MGLEGTGLTAGLLEDAYEAAWDEWALSGEEQVWDIATGDGLEAGT